MITDQTTLIELQYESAKRGVTFLVVKMQDGLVLAGAQLHHGDNFVIGEGKTVPEAIAIAFDRIDRNVGKQLVKPLPSPPVVGPSR